MDLQGIIDTLTNVVEQNADFAQANGVDPSDEGDAFRKSFKEDVDILSSLVQLNIKVQDADERRTHEHDENMRKLDIEEQKIALENKKENFGLLKAAMFCGTAGLMVGVITIKETTGENISRLGESAMMSVLRIFPFGIGKGM